MNCPLTVYLKIIPRKWDFCTVRQLTFKCAKQKKHHQLKCMVFIWLLIIWNDCWSKNSESIHPTIEHLVSIGSCDLIFPFPVSGSLFPFSAITLCWHFYSPHIPPAHIYTHGLCGVGEHRSDKWRSECGGGWLWMPDISVGSAAVSAYSDFIQTLTRGQETLNRILISEVNRTSLAFILHI